jgi:DnaJ-domain-containing protein 1
MNESERRKQVKEVKRKIEDQKQEFLIRVQADREKLGEKTFREIYMANLKTINPDPNDFVYDDLKEQLWVLETHPIQFQALSRKLSKIKDTHKLNKQDLETISRALELTTKYQDSELELSKHRDLREKALKAFGDNKDKTKDNKKASYAACVILGFTGKRKRPRRSEKYLSRIKTVYFYLVIEELFKSREAIEILMGRKFGSNSSRKAVIAMIDKNVKCRHKDSVKKNIGICREHFASHRVLGDDLREFGFANVCGFNNSKKTPPFYTTLTP